MDCPRVFLLMLMFLVQGISGAEPTVTPEVVLGDLESPCGVAVQPETGHVFVSDSGRARVVRLIDGQPQEVVVGFPQEVYGTDPAYRIGPLGLAFLNSEILVIGGGGEPVGEDVLYVVSVPPVGSPPIRAEQAMRFGPLAAEKNEAGEGDFYAITATAEAIFATSQGDDDQGWIVVVPILKADQLNAPAGYGKLTRFVATKPLVQTNAPMGITMSPRGELVVGQMGEISEIADSRLTFYRLGDGTPLLDLATGLYDVTSIAYGAPQAPTNKPHLYALDFAWKVPEAAGLYRLDAQLKDNRPAIAATRIATLDKPTAMAWGLDGSLFVTLCGTAEDGEQAKSGKLVRFAAGL